jgi:hypothetical protein
VHVSVLDSDSSAGSFVARPAVTNIDDIMGTMSLQDLAYTYRESAQSM